MAQPQPTPTPTREDVLDVYTDFIQRCQSLTVSHQYSYPAAVHVRSARALVDSARTLIDILDRYPAAVGVQALPSTGEISTALRLAVPTLLVHSGYAVPPMPELPFVFNQLTRIDHHLGPGRMAGRLREAGQALEEISRSVIDVPGAGAGAARDTARRRRGLVSGVLHVSHRLVPFLTAATAVACAPLLLPVAGGITAALVAVGTPLVGVLLPSRDELRAFFHSRPNPLVVPQSQLLTMAAETSLDEAEKLLRPPADPTRQAWARLACRAADQHLSALLADTVDPASDETLRSLAERAENIQTAIDALPPEDIRPVGGNGPTCGF